MNLIKKILPFLHAIIVLYLAFVFIKAGMKNYSKPLRKVEQEQVMQQVFVENSYAAPVGYNLTMNTFNQNGYLKLIGTLEIIAAILMIIPWTRLAGLIVLFPILLNIFLLHVFIDNRPHEIEETGILLGLNFLGLIYYWDKLKLLLWVKVQNLLPVIK